MRGGPINSMKKLTVALSVLACLPALAGAQVVVEEIVARVNNQIITKSEFERSKDQLRDEVKTQDAANADKLYADREKDVLRDLIDQQLLLEKGKDLGMNGDTDLIKALDEMRKEMKLASLEDLEKEATKQGVSWEDFKQERRNQLITQKVIGEEVGQHLSVTKDEVQAFYDQHKNEMEQPEAIRLSEILVAPKIAAAPAPPPAAPAADPNAAATPAAQPAADDTAALGIAEAKAKDLEDRTFAMKGGEITDVIRTKQGYVILKVNEHITAGIPSLKEVLPRIQDALYYQKLQPALRAYLTKLREDAYIYYMPGYVDSGMSPNQTNPIETAAAKEADAKKLKKKKKLGIL